MLIKLITTLVTGNLKLFLLSYFDTITNIRWSSTEQHIETTSITIYINDDRQLDANLYSLFSERTGKAIQCVLICLKQWFINLRQQQEMKNTQ